MKDNDASIVEESSVLVVAAAVSEGANVVASSCEDSVEGSASL